MKTLQNLVRSVKILHYLVTFEHIFCAYIQGLWLKDETNEAKIVEVLRSADAEQKQRPRSQRGLQTMVPPLACGRCNMPETLR